MQGKTELQAAAVIHVKDAGDWVGKGRLEDAERHFQYALQCSPENVEALLGLSEVLSKTGRDAEAGRYLDTALSLSPGRADVLRACAAHHYLHGDFAAAVHFNRLLRAIAPENVEVLVNLAVALTADENVEAAIEVYDNIVLLSPERAEILAEIGRLYILTDRRDLALAPLEQAISLGHDVPETWCDFGIVLASHGQLQRSTSAFRKALDLRPDFPAALDNLARVLKDSGYIEESLDTLRRAQKIAPEDPKLFSNYAYTLQFLPGVTLQQIKDAHAAWSDRFCPAVAGSQNLHRSDFNPARKLRLGFLSGDFRFHPTAFFIVGTIERLAHIPLESRGGMRGFLGKISPKRACEIILYANQTQCDDLTQRFIGAADIWNNVSHLSDDALLERIREDQIDILFDLAGHTATGRLFVFAERVAPIQIAWAGYMATTGLRNMDYLIGDRFETPAGVDSFYTERIIRLPDSFICYSPPMDAPEVSRLPMEENGYVTFGYFNILGKINEPVLDVWCRILRALPASRLVLKTKGLQCEDTKKYFLRRFLERGIDPGRIDCLPASGHAEHLRAYHRVDISLDPFPFSGSTTTLESLWMGVPVITLPGETFASRHSLSYLMTVGLSEWVACNENDYVDRAVNFPATGRLRELRGSLRQRMQMSPMCNAPRHAENLYNAIRAVWKDYGAKRSQDATRK